MDIPSSSQVPNPASSSEERALVDHGAGGAAEASLGAAAGSTSMGSASASETLRGDVATAEAKYEGERNAAGKRHGKGTMTYPGGEVYVGDWRDGEKHGQGKYSFADGNVYEGGWVDGKKHGEGKFSFADGTVYEGGVVNNKKHGEGKVTFADGDAFRNVWSEGKETREREWL